MLSILLDIRYINIKIMKSQFESGFDQRSRTKWVIEQKGIIIGIRPNTIRELMGLYKDVAFLSSIGPES